MQKMDMMAIFKVCSHLADFSPFYQNGPLNIKRAEWVSTQLARLMVHLLLPLKRSKRRAKIW